MKEPGNSNQLSLISTNKDSSKASDKSQELNEPEPLIPEPTPVIHKKSLATTTASNDITRPVPGKRLFRTDIDSQASKKTSSSLWYALYFPQLVKLDDRGQQEALTHLAAVAEAVSSTVSFHPLALVCEIRSSLNYFGGINPLHNKLTPTLKAKLAAIGQPEHFFYAASPTVTGSLLLARSGYNTLVHQRSNLRSALGQLSTNVLQLSEEQNRRLHNMGIRNLRDIWRLPSDGIRKRFGSEFVNQLNKALGKTQEPTQNYLPLPTFSCRYELAYELENLDRLLPIMDEMLAQLCDFLVRRDLSTNHLLFSLLHEKRNPTAIDISLRQASRSRKQFLLLVEAYFSQLIIPSPVIEVSLEVEEFDAFTGYTENLPLTGKPDSKARDNNLNQFMEQLKARLGDNYLRTIATLPEHCPEHASIYLNFNSQSKKDTTMFRANEVTLRPRPLWLLKEPKQLVNRNGRLYHQKPITIISGPERIESYWWSGRDVCRDYYVAREITGSRLWIFRERHGEKHWWLHGYFS